MKKITIEELVDKLNNLENKEIQLDFKGMITTKLKIKFNKILKTEDYIDIFREDAEDDIRLNTHQIMKVQIISDEEIILQFDGPQTVNILIKK